MKQKAFSLLAALLIGAATLPAAAQEQLIYWCKDASGRTSLQDKPCPGMVVVPAKAEQPQQQEDVQMRDGGTFSVLPAARQPTPALAASGPARAAAPAAASSGARVIRTGQGGGKYYINASGNKVYVSSSGAAASSSRPHSTYSGPSSAAGRSLYTGPRGGQYYINSRGNKVYVRKK